MADENYDWKNAFKKNRVKIVKGLANPDEVATQLFQSEIFNVEMHETILQIHEKENKTRKILDTLNYREKKGVAALHDAFMETQNKDLAKKLAPYVIEVAKRDSKTEPTEWPPSEDEQEEMLNDQLITIKDKNSPWFTHEYDKEYVYKIQGKCRGKVFIINNVKFGKRMAERTASNLDANNLEELFTKLHFSVQRWNNLTADDMKSKLYNEAEKLEEDTTTECVILIIMSHGGGKRVYGVDCLPVELNTLIEVFSSVNCPNLNGKPRLVFVQACRSDEIASIEKSNHLGKLGGQVEINCNVKTDKPVLDIFWEKDESFRITDKYCLRSIESKSSIVVKNVQDRDKGKYRCIVKYEKTYQTNPAELEFPVGNASIKKTFHLVQSGSKVQIECIVDADKQIRDVVWERDIDGVKYSITEKTSPEKYGIEKSKGKRGLIVQNVEYSDEGKYRCMVKYIDGSEDQSNSTEIKFNLKDGAIASIKQTIHLVKPGGQIIIECFINTNNPIQEVSWEKDAKGAKYYITEKNSPKKYRLESEARIHRLVIMNVEESDKGKYSCVIKYESECPSNPTVLDVKNSDQGDVTEKDNLLAPEPRDETDYEPSHQEIKEYTTLICSFPDHPISYATPEDKIASASIENTKHLVKPGGQVEINCNVKTDTPVLEIFWVKDQKCFRNTDKYCLRRMESMSSLVVKNVKDSDEGKYRCIVKYEETYQTNPAVLEFPVGNASIKKPLHLVQFEKQVQVECIVDADKQIRKVVWERDIDGVKFSITEKTNPSKYRLEISKDIRRLIVQDVTFTDEGKYRCLVKYDDGSKNQSNRTEIKVDATDGTIASITQTIHLVKPGGQVIIECVINSNTPIRELSWEKDAKGVKCHITEKTNPKKYRLENETRIKRLVIMNVGDSDKGEYRCIIKYESGYQSNPTVLNVQHSGKGDVTEKNKLLTKEPYDETDSVPAQEEKKEFITPICSFPGHPRADFLIAYATPEGTKAWLHRDVGSWFMNAIVWTFKYHAHEEELHHLLIRVNRLVGKGSTKSKDMTVAEVKSNLRKKFYFFPGIHSNPPDLFSD